MCVCACVYHSSNIDDLCVEGIHPWTRCRGDKWIITPPERVSIMRHALVRNETVAN